jgi:hypothetical protein
MANIPNKLVLFGAVAAAALAVPSLLSPLMFEQAYANHRSQAIEEVDQVAVGGLAAVNANIGANANVEVEDNQVAACVIVDRCDPQN